MPRKTSTAVESRLKKRFKADELRAKLAHLKTQLAMGKSELEIAKELGVTIKTYQDLRKELLRQETTAMYEQTSEEVYLDYKWKQLQCVDAIDKAIAVYQSGNNFNALVGAIRVKSDILDKLIKVGQDMGMLARVPESKMLIQGVVVAEMDNSELRKMITKEMTSLSSVMSKYGDKDFSGKTISLGDQKKIPSLPPGQVINVTPGPEFSAQGKPKETRGSMAKAKAARKQRNLERRKSVAKGTIKALG